MIERIAKRTLQTLSKGFPVVVVTGPRQSGKSTIVKSTFAEKTYVSFDEIDILESAKADPRGFLSRFHNGAVIDEVQKCPEMFPHLKAYVDQKNTVGEFVLTGSQQFGLVSQITESLAGRAGFVQLLPFCAQELSAASKLPSSINELLFKGMYPPLYDRDILPKHWFNSYVTSYIERDVRSVINVKDLSTFQKFLRLCAARTGQLLNISSLCNDCGISTQTGKNWISVLEASYVVFLLQPHFVNFGKRLIKTPKIYFYDTGLAAWLLNIQDIDHLSIHPSKGALFENFVISELLKQRFNLGVVSNLYFWRDNLGDEIDVLIDNGSEHIPVEIKSGETLLEDYFKNLNKWKKITGKEVPSYLVYAGQEMQTRHFITTIPWHKVSEIGA